MTDRVAIRRCGAEVLDALEPLWRALQEHHVAVAPIVGGFGPRPPDDAWAARRRRYAAGLAVQDAFVMLAERAEVAVGYALVRLGDGLSSWECGGRLAEIETLSVLPEARGQGIGSQLMDAVEGELQRLGVRAARVTVVAANAGALRFYERRGMTPISTILLGSVESQRCS